LAFDEYEKSVFLTNAQEDIVLSLYTGRNMTLESFENTEERRRYLSNLVREAILTPITTTNGNVLGMESNSKFFTLPEDLWFITYEAIKVNNTCKEDCAYINFLEVIPITQDEYHKIKRNPFRGTNSRRALRLDLSDNVIEVICNKAILYYYIRYIKKCNPIVLINLPDNLSIQGVSTKQECELHEALHKKILERAVILAV